MGEEEKKSPSEKEKKGEEKKPEEGEKPKDEGKEKGEESKKEDNKEEKKKQGKDKEAAPSDEIVLRVYMHCEGCARKVRRCLRRVEGVKDVQVDCKEHKVVVKGTKADPLKVLDAVQRKSHRKVELLTPLLKPSTKEKKSVEKEAKAEDKKEKLPVIVVVLKVHMHCEACTEEIRKRIVKMKGVQEATPELKTSQVTVKGVFQAAELVEYVYKRTGKHAIIVKQQVEKIEEEKGKGKESKEEKGKGNESKEEKGKGNESKEEKGKGKESKEEKGDGEAGKKAESEKEGQEAKGSGGEGEGESTTKADVKKYEYLQSFYQHQDPLYAVEYVYPPQIFSDENPNACSVM